MEGLLFSRRVVGWVAGEANDRKLALRALERALHSRRPGPGLTHHTDRGSLQLLDNARRYLDAYVWRRTTGIKALAIAA